MSAVTERLQAAPEFTEMERAVINRLQTGLPLVHSPYAAVAGELGITEQALLHTLEDLLDRRILTRFGPMFHAGEMGGGLTLAAMRIPEQDFEDATRKVNAFDEVAHKASIAHLSGDCNVFADAVSRSLWKRFFALCRAMGVRPVKVATPA